MATGADRARLPPAELSLLAEAKTPPREREAVFFCAMDLSAGQFSYPHRRSLGFGGAGRGDLLQLMKTRLPAPHLLLISTCGNAMPAREKFLPAMKPVQKNGDEIPASSRLMKC
ncbi:hypothetical protein LQR31_09215 [Chromobacterium vaccinii]|uniref:hypothetical protein n=1 Tax=Chromobacterium vaccinii TaxID=1108595 RepID=UPI001E5F62B7|nr:hypothetical protein [Chromobacterium vaccinii]MCD4484648.1 hypothetical protein [Chromobacterium vaccinii]